MFGRATAQPRRGLSVRRCRRWRVAGCLGLLVALLFSPAWLAARSRTKVKVSAEVAARADKLIAQAVAARAAGKPAEARAQLERAYRLVAEPTVLFHLGQLAQA